MLQQAKREKLNNQKYAVSHYTLIQEGDITIWETMQSSPEGTASWRGELKEGKMQGILSLRAKGEQPQDFSFTSIRYRRK